MRAMPPIAATAMIRPRYFSVHDCCWYETRRWVRRPARAVPLGLVLAGRVEPLEPLAPEAPAAPLEAAEDGFEDGAPVVPGWPLARRCCRRDALLTWGKPLVTVDGWPREGT